ncbi:MAG TPA: glycoside hydrolase family 9 protein [Caulobacterales bacterium]|nr:glycoside hydrolase family 9 protein [Caulobacterales bacterium]
MRAALLTVLAVALSIGAADARTQRAAPAAAPAPAQQTLTLTDRGYYEERGLNVLVFSNWYDGNFSDSKISGVELIHHGVRTATNGDVRMLPTPGQWDDIGSLVNRTVDQAHGVIETHLRYDQYDFNYTIRSEAQGDSVIVSVVLDRPLPEALVGKAGFNLEFIPSAYFHRSFIADGVAGAFPIYPSGDMQRIAPPGPPQRIGRSGDSVAAPLPIATARRFSLAPEDPERTVSIASSEPVSFYDGRNQAQNGWFVFRSLLPAGRSGAVLQWTIRATTIPGWTRAPMIAHSQLGYAPQQDKIAVIELDRNDTGAPATARLVRVNADGSSSVALEGPAAAWQGAYLRYNYRRFDFSSVREPGLYVIEYEGQRTVPFRIARDIYAEAWHPTNDVFLAVQMDHVLVSEAYRVWHGDSHRDDARQAPINHEHIDLWAQGPTTDNRFRPGEHIPGINVGGWYDAGDFDLPTTTQFSVVHTLARVREQYHVERDETAIDERLRHVEIHQPDGKPDVLQQVEHGMLWLLATQRAFGYAINGVTEPYVWQYHHLGDAVTKTDGLVYDPRLRFDQVRGNFSGVDDDRWAFTNHSTSQNYGSAAAFAAAARVLKGYNDAMANEALAAAQRIWTEEHARPPSTFQHGNTTGGNPLDAEFSAAVELLATTHDQKYADRIEAMWPQVHERFMFNARTVARAIPLMPPAYKARAEADVRALAAQLTQMTSANPFGMLITEGGWAGDSAVVQIALTQHDLHQQFPDLIGDDMVFRSLAYLYGTHPGSNVSFVSGVGSVSKEVAYGNNRADFSFIAGGVVPGELILKPDFPENREDWPFFWGQNEYVVALGASYIELVQAANEIAQRDH